MNHGLLNAPNRVKSTKMAIRHALLGFHSKGRLIQNAQDFEQLLDRVIDEIVRLSKRSDQVLNERQVVQMYPFLTVRALQNIKT